MGTYWLARQGAQARLTLRFVMHWGSPAAGEQHGGLQWLGDLGSMCACRCLTSCPAAPPAFLRRCMLQWATFAQKWSTGAQEGNVKKQPPPLCPVQAGLSMRARLT